MSFTHVLGHDRVVDRLAGAAARGAPHHAYIFHGPDGVGRRQVAIGFAAALNCGHVDASGACGECGSCTRIQSGTDADVWIVEPTPPEGRKSGSLAIRINHVRELQSLIDYKNFTPALPTGHPFTGVVSSGYWSSTTYADSTAYAWFVNLVNGFVFNGNKTITYYVWPVRGGE